eukprot:2447581-Pyramimonas_sp.AAC.1
MVPHDLLGEPLAKKASELRNGALAQAFLVIQASWWRPGHGDKGSRSTFLHRYSENHWPERPPNSGTEFSLEISSHFSQWPKRKIFPPKGSAIKDEVG